MLKFQIQSLEVFLDTYEPNNKNFPKPLVSFPANVNQQKSRVSSIQPDGFIIDGKRIRKQLRSNNVCVTIDNTTIWQIMVVYAVSRSTYNNGFCFEENTKQNAQQCQSVLYETGQLNHCGRGSACFGQLRGQQRVWNECGV
jgi:hypothetical protein